MNLGEAFALIRKHADPNTVDPVSGNLEWVTITPYELLAAFNDAVAAEREACAMVCDLLLADPISSEWARATHGCAAAIRARGSHEHATQDKALSRATAQDSLPVDLDHCPSCGGPADNGNDRLIPPNPYVCSKCAVGYDYDPE